MMRMLVNVMLALLLGACASGTAPRAAEAPPPPRRIALSFDDAPRTLGPWLSAEERTRRLIAALRSVRAPQAVFFVNPGNLAEPHGRGGEARLRAYVRAGHVIANHSFSHPALTAVTAEAYLADIDRAESWLRGRRGYRPWFRFPYLNEGGGDAGKRNAVFAGLEQRGLRHGYVTVASADWRLEQLTIDAVRTGTPIDRAALRDYYVENSIEAAEAYDDIARRAWGRSPAHVLLLHETDLAAFYIADLVRAFRARGWQIISADEAYADPIAALPPPVVPSAHGSLTELAAWERGLPAPRWYRGNNERVMTAAYNQRVLHRPPAPPTP
jgi:peptidoglycan-N-acetylglucosamine deacetylase